MAKKLESEKLTSAVISANPQLRSIAFHDLPLLTLRKSPLDVPARIVRSRAKSGERASERTLWSSKPKFHACQVMPPSSERRTPSSVVLAKAMRSRSKLGEAASA